MSNKEFYRNIIICLVIVLIIVLIAISKKANYSIINSLSSSDAKNCEKSLDECVMVADQTCQACMNNVDKYKSCKLQCGLRNTCFANYEDCKMARGETL